jgi:hypothetical protein
LKPQKRGKKMKNLSSLLNNPMKMTGGTIRALIFGIVTACCLLSLDHDADGGASSYEILLDTDQRGSARPWDPLATGTEVCDIGAFEWTNCMNGAQDSDEEGIDCGGSCAACSCTSTGFAAVGNTTFSYIQDAYDLTWDGAEIRAREEDTGEALIFDRPAHITLIGGHNCNFFRTTGITTIASLTVSAG